MNLGKTIRCGVSVAGGLALLAGLATAADADDRRGGVRARAADPSVARAAAIWSLTSEAGEFTAPADCSAAQPDRRRFFLPQFIAAGTSTTECTVPAGRPVVVNLGGTLCWEDETTSASEVADACAAFYAAPEGRPLASLWVDGQELDVPAATATGAFVVTPPADNIFELPAEPLTFAYVGRNVELAGLRPGTHTVDVTFRAPPGPDQFDVVMHIVLQAV